MCDGSAKAGFFNTTRVHKYKTGRGLPAPPRHPHFARALKKKGPLYFYYSKEMKKTETPSFLARPIPEHLNAPRAEPQADPQCESKQSGDWPRSQAQREQKQAAEEVERGTAPRGGAPVLHHHTSSCVRDTMGQVDLTRWGVAERACFQRAGGRLCTRCDL